MNEEVLKILQEKDREYEEPVSLEGFDIIDILEEEEVEYEFLFPEEYAKRQYSSRNRRGSTYGTYSRRELEEDLNQNFYESRGKDARSSRTKTIELNYDDYKEVNYLKDLLTVSKPKGLSSSIKDYSFTEKDDPLLPIGTKPYADYNPPEINVGHPFISKFTSYFDLFSGQDSKTQYFPKWTLETALKYMRSSTKEVIRQENNSKTSLEVVRSNAETKERSKVDSDVVDANYSIDKTTHSFLTENTKTFKQTGNGLPNALVVSDQFIVIGMSKSQLMFFPNETVQNRQSDMNDIYASNSPVVGKEPFVIGSAVNGNDVGSVLSLSMDLSGTLCAVGYSGGNIDIVNIEKRSIVKTISDVHVTAVVFVRFLSNSSVLSIDYDGNVNISTFNKKLFGTNISSSRIINRKQYGQIVDVSIIPFSLTMTHSTEENHSIAVDLVALTTLETTIILTINNNQANVIFTLKRDPLDISSSSDKFDPKTQYVNNCLSTAFYRNTDNSFLFVRSDDTVVDAWTINTKLDQNNRLQYSIQHFSRYTLSAIIFSCFLLSPYHLYCIMNNLEIVIIDLQINQIVRTISFNEKNKYIFGNVNRKLQSMMRTVDEDEEEVKGVVANSRVFTNSMFATNNTAYILCFNQLLIVEETDLEKRYSKYLENDDPLNALYVGVSYVNTLSKQLEVANETAVDDGETRIRYYGFVNRLSSAVLRLVESSSLPVEERLGCAFDVLTSIERVELIFTSVFSLCSDESDLTTERFFTILTEYLKAHRIDHILPSILNQYLSYIEEHFSLEERYHIELLMLPLNYATGGGTVDETISVFSQHHMLFAVSSLFVNGKGDYISPIRYTYKAIQEEQNLDYFCRYPNVVDTLQSTSQGLQALYSFFLFLLHTAVFGVTLTGNLLNSLGRVSNQNDCFSFLMKSPSSDSILHKLLRLYPDYMLALVFYALSVRAMTPAPVPKSSLLDSDEDEDEALHAAVEMENYKAFYTTLATNITAGLVSCLELHDLSTAIEEKMMYILLDLMSEWYVSTISGDLLVYVFHYLENHTYLIKKEKIQSIIQLYSFDDSVAAQVTESLVNIQCYQECILLLEKEKYYDKILQLFFTRIRQTTDKDNIHNITVEIEAFLGKIVKKETSSDETPCLFEKMKKYCIPLMYLNNHIFSYYLLILAGGDHSIVLSLLQEDETAIYLYLQQFFIHCEMPSLTLSSSFVMSTVSSCQSSITDTILIQFATLLLKNQRTLLRSFIEYNSLSPEAASAILELASQQGITTSVEIEDIGATCLLYHLTGRTEEALQTINQTLTRSSDQLKQHLRSLFNIKDLEKPFICLQGASQILLIFSHIFPAATADFSYETLQETYLQSCWKQLLYDSTEMISQVRKVLSLKTDMNGNRKIIAGLELLEKTAAGLLQQVLDTLQVKIPLAVLLSSVLNQNSGNTIRDISGIVTKVIQSLQMDIEGFENFVHIYRGDYNECLHQKVELMKHGTVIQYETCFGCGGELAGEECRVFACGHVYHTRCCQSTCSYCETVKSLSIRKKVKHEYLHILKKNDTTEMKSSSSQSEVERWRHFKGIRNEQNSGTLYSIYDSMNGNVHEFSKLLEPPSLFSSIPEFPDIDPDMLLVEPQIGSLPIKPSMKGECVLLPNP